MTRINQAFAILLVLLSGLLGAGPPTSQGPTTAPSLAKDSCDRLKAQARQMVDAAAANDNNKVLDLLYPKLVAKAGRDKLLAVMESMQKQMKAQGVKLTSAEFGDPSQVVEKDGTTYAVLPETATLEVPVGSVEQKSFMLGISEDGGKSWTFVDGASGGKAMRKLLPDLPEELKLPGKPTQTLTPTEAK
jgi:hypothetical protein